VRVRRGGAPVTVERAHPASVTAGLIVSLAALAAVVAGLALATRERWRRPRRRPAARAR
jgi:hypothetical protein